eukprot:Gregarina_sp_Poly_1__1647@NODE_141_length_12988_cov_478_019271_g126_i0_p7_GENE_NODE_141_length_12988_cov_478_019271_g126_i0NODE_141_length_12988_cov_478_019271_g126_i0_p7_ORF_typecomplete_len303_score54_50_NODE_141_length_12988_cov_478_019271_g126_i079868894
MDVMDDRGPTYEEERIKTILILLRCLKFEPEGADRTAAARDAFLRGCRQQRVADLCDILLRCMFETAEAVRNCFAQALPLQTFMGYLMTLTMATDTVASYLTSLGNFIGNDGFNNMSDFIRVDQATGIQKLMVEVLTCLRDFQRQYFPSQAQPTTMIGLLTPPLAIPQYSSRAAADTHRGSTPAWQLSSDGAGGRAATTGADYLTNQVDAEALQVLLDNCRQTLEQFYLLMTDDNFEGDSTQIGRRDVGMSQLFWKSRNDSLEQPKLHSASGENESSSEAFDRVIAMLKQSLFEPLSLQSSS